MSIIAFATSDKLSVSEQRQPERYETSNVLSNLPFVISNDTSTKRINNLKNELTFSKCEKFTLQINPFLFKSTHLTRIEPKRTKSVVCSKAQAKSLKSIIKSAETFYKIPENLLLAIAKVETGVRPYTINYNGRGYFFSNKLDAVNFAQNLVNRRITNFSVGCFQLHYNSHKGKFKNLHEMFEPEANTIYAAKFLKRLYKDKGYDWQTAVKAYHSKYKTSNDIYYTKIKDKLGRSVI